MTDHKPHISVCVCTYKRPQYLRRLLTELSRQQTDDRFSYSVVIADNDSCRSAERIVMEAAEIFPVSIAYCVEARQNIALARNMAFRHSSGEFIAFIDDDEFPIEKWLVTLFNTLAQYDVDGVLGPVKAYFQAVPPRWVLQGHFHDRPMHPTGTPLGWNDCRTGNVLLKRTAFGNDAEPFRKECLSGEDQDFFKRAMKRGHQFIWCNDAVAYEEVPPARWTRSFLVRRAIMRGVFSLRNHNFPPLRILRSLVATPVYLAILPFALLLGQSTFMRQVFKLSYHIGRILAVLGVDPIKQAYVTD